MITVEQIGAIRQIEPYDAGRPVFLGPEPDAEEQEANRFTAQVSDTVVVTRSLPADLAPYNAVVRCDPHSVEGVLFYFVVQLL